MFLLAAAWGFAQIQHEIAVVNISVPARVYYGARFVDSLGLGDFEVCEDGRAQPIEAVYLIRGGAVKKREGMRGTPIPETQRNFVLLFQLSEYIPEIDKAVDLFFESVCRPGDAVDIVTPQRTLRLRNRIDTPDKVKKAQYEVKSKLKNDVLVLSGTYRSLIGDMLAHLGARDAEYSDVDLDAYRTDLERLEALRTIDQDRMAAFAADLKGKSGSKHVFLFYQREKIPQFSNSKIVEALSNSDSEMALKVMESMAAQTRDDLFNRQAVQRAFSDASIDVHFLYITRNRWDPQRDVENAAVFDGIQMAESSAAIYKVFKEIAAATGGTSAASANPAALLRQAAAAAEDYYLIYYRPQSYQADGAFHEIGVTVKLKGLRVSHRGGYFAEGVGTSVAKQPAGEQAGEKAAAAERNAQALTKSGKVIEDIDLVDPIATKGNLVPKKILEAVACYCRDLSAASLDFVCREQVRERLSGALAEDVSILKDVIREWVYDYQLVRKEGWSAETRILLEENGKSRRRENARLATTRFDHKFVVLGPVGLFSTEAQLKHDYWILREAEVEGEPVLVIDVRPKGLETSSLYGKAWVRLRDGAVLKIEWEPASMGNYAAIEDLAKSTRAKPRINFFSEYAVEKNGLRFPSSYKVVESYRTARGTVVLSRTDIVYKDYKFFEVNVRTDVRWGG